MKVNWDDDSQYMEKMFRTTNEMNIVISIAGVVNLKKGFHQENMQMMWKFHEEPA